MKTFLKSFTLSICLFITAPGYSQTSVASGNLLTEPDWNWSKKYAGNGGPFSKDIISDGNGNYYLTGYFNGSLTFSNITINSSGTCDLYLVKVNSSGDAVWVKQVSASTGKSIIPCRLILMSNGDFLVGGQFDGTAGFSANTLVSSGHTDAFVARFDASGNNLWAGKYSDPENLVATGLATDASGNSYMTINIPSGNKAKIISFNSSGQPQISQSYDHAYFNDITCRNTSLYICGYLSAATSFGSISLSSGYYPSAFFGQTDLSGNFTWADNGKSQTGDSRAYSVSVDNNGNLYSTGYFIDSIRFKPASFKLLANGIFPLFIVKYNPSGTCLWASQIDAGAYDYHPRMSLDNQGNPFIFCYCYSGLTFGSSTISPESNFIASYSSAGTEQWAKELPYFPVMMQVLTSGEIIQCTDNFFNTMILKFDATANLQWTKKSTSDGGLSEVWYQIAVDHEGMPYYHGHIRGTVNFNGNNVTAYGAGLAKLNGDGTVIWEKSFTTTLNQTVDPSGVTIDLNNNCFAWGTYSDSLTIDGNLLGCPHGSGYMAYLVKYDKHGKLDWIRTIEVYTSLTGVGGITTDKSGNVAISGWFYDTLHINNTFLVSHNNGNNSDVFIIKFTSGGDLVYAKGFGGTSTVMGRGISADALDNVYIAGAFRGTANFGNNSLTSLGGYDVFLAKYDANGNPLWAKQAGSVSSSGYERAHAIITDSAGNSYISGLFWSNSMNFGSLSITSPWINNLFIAKYAPDGTPLWAHALRSPTYTWPAYQLGLDEEGSCYMGGTYYDTLVFENGQTYTGTWNNNFLVKYDAGGSYQWNKNIPMSVFSAGYTDLFGVAAYNKNSVLIGGRITNDTLTLGSNKLYSYNSGAFIALLGDNLPMGVSNQDQAKKHIAIYPNPSHGAFNLRFDDPSKKSFLFIVSDADGKAVFSGHETCGETAVILLPHLSPGVYLISVYDGNGKYSEKLVLY